MKQTLANRCVWASIGGNVRLEPGQAIQQNKR